MELSSLSSTQDYFDIIKNPMDLRTIRNKLEEGHYSNPWEVGLHYFVYSSHLNYTVLHVLCACSNVTWSISETTSYLRRNTACSVYSNVWMIM